VPVPSRRKALRLNEVGECAENRSGTSSDQSLRDRYYMDVSGDVGKFELGGEEPGGCSTSQPLAPLQD
jgi:hypothetical protein